MGKKQKNNRPDQQSSALQLSIIHTASAGIDVGSMKMMVSYNTKEGEQIVKEYDAYTSDLLQLAIDLKEAGVTHVGMEATGVYWVAVYDILEQHGLKPTLV